MPDFYPEGDRPLPTDDEQRSLAKAVSLLGQLVEGGGLPDYELKSASFTAESGKAYATDTTSASIEVTLPASPTAGDVIAVADAKGTWGTNPVVCIRNGHKIEGTEVDFTNNAAGTFFSLLYIDAATGWRVLASGTKPLNLTAPTVSGTYNFTGTAGTWTGSPTSFAYQWQISDDGLTGWADIEGATSLTYLATEPQEGKFVRLGVIATNANGPSVEVFSAASAEIDIPPFPVTGLLAFWKLDDLTDASGNGNTLTNNNSVTFGAGKIGNAAVFAGSNYLSSSLDLPEGDFTISAWINCTQATGQCEVVGNFTGGGGALFQNSTSIYYANDSGASVQLNGPVIVNSGWVHIIITRSGSLFTMYVDGVEYISAAATGVGSNIIGIAIGKNSYYGMIDAVGVWTRALTEPEITQLYAAGAGDEL